MQLYNTLTRKIEEFYPLHEDFVRLYTCGPTVYDYTHIGHLRKYINDDILRRTLELDGYAVKHVMNITDVGHLASDADTGEDKLEKGAKKFGKSVLEVARFFESDFWQSLDSVNTERPTIVARATEHIKDQIELIEILEEKGFTYRTDQAIYFDVSKFPDYNRLSGQSLEEQMTGARDDVVVDTQKKNPQDFALWFFTVGRFADHALRWDSPWGEGFPGWHIECSAMAMSYLGPQLDIHTGGIDHIPVHHTNERAQSEAASGVEFVKFWVHHAFLLVDDEKMSKSLANFYTVKDLQEKKLSPLAYRYLVLQTHYRSEMNFTWKSLNAAQNALDHIYEIALSLGTEKGDGLIEYERDFLDALNLDLNAPKALSILWEMLRSKGADRDKLASLIYMDQVLGLKILEQVDAMQNIPPEIQALLAERQKARRDKKYGESDKIRTEIESKGYIVKDLDNNRTQILKKI